MKCPAITIHEGKTIQCDRAIGHRAVIGNTVLHAADVDDGCRRTRHCWPGTVELDERGVDDDGYVTVHQTPAAFDLSDVKPRWDLIPWDLMQSVERVFTAGGLKPGRSDFGWKDRPRAEHFQAFLRHVFEYVLGKRIDEETGQPVLAHIIARASMLMFHDGKDGK